MRSRGDTRLSSFLPESIARLQSACATAEEEGELAELADALRRLAIACHHRAETDEARELCRRSYDVACEVGERQLAAEALNTLGGIDLASGSLDEAHRTFLQARELGGASRVLRARVEQNLGIVANIRGDQLQALAHYQRSLEEYRALGDEHGCAIAYHNLGMVNADRGLFEAAACYFQESYAIAERTGNTYLQGLCLVNQGEVEVARTRYEVGRDQAEAALQLFAQLGAEGPQASAHRVIGMAHREAGRATLAEASLKTAMEVAISTGSVLSQAEASQELGLLYEGMGRDHDAQRWINIAHGLLRRLNGNKRPCAS
jgi:tetratricopeptide (TPR) repeat protein